MIERSKFLWQLSKYPWAKTRSWAAWRHLYVKNDSMFDMKISKLLKMKKEREGNVSHDGVNQKNSSQSSENQNRTLK